MFSGKSDTNKNEKGHLSYEEIERMEAERFAGRMSRLSYLHNTHFSNSRTAAQSLPEIGQVEMGEFWRMYMWWTSS